MQKITLKIAGMSCDHCKTAVEEKLEKLDGVDDVTVNLAEGIAKIVYDADEVGVGQLQQAIVDAGYQVIELY